MPINSPVSPTKRGVQLELLDEVSGQLLAQLQIHLRPNDPPEWLAEAQEGERLASVQLLEGCEYVYELLNTAAGRWQVDLPEVFSADDEGGQRGRLKTGLLTGLLTPRFALDGRVCKPVALEVRSQKLDYLSHYRWMLRDLSEHFGELVAQKFAASQLRFRPAPQRDPRALYPRCAYLGSILESGEFEAAMSQIVHRPQRKWRREEELQRPGRGISAHSQVARQFGQPGAKVPLALPHLPFAPRQILARRQVESRDTAENRVVKFILEEWMQTLDALQEALQMQKESAPRERGLYDCRRWKSILDRWYAEPLFREVGRLDYFPGGSTVLQKRPGYREVFGCYLSSQAASEITWSADEDTFTAGQKNVAALYEYWTFLQLAQSVGRVIGKPLDWDQMVELSDDRLCLHLRQGGQCVLRGEFVERNRHLQIELWFNRTYRPGSGSWTAQLRPDCSLQVHGQGLPSPVVVHFDAKYRLSENPLTSLEDPERNARNDDLLKMHAYRDAIRHSEGAYVLFPGNVSARHQQYSELLPGLGAFPLTPSEHGSAAGVHQLDQFLTSLLSHCGEQYSQHERHRYWETQTYQSPPSPTGLPQFHFLTRPPQDTQVLLGYVRSPAHWDWVQQTGLYNLRADSRRGSISLHSRELSAEFVLTYTTRRARLWRVSGAPRLYTRDMLLRSQYPGPKGELYLCLPIEPVEWECGCEQQVLEELKAETRGAPRVATWLEVAGRVVRL
jgi:predicted component of viral defense system (DUF524 family)